MRKKPLTVFLTGGLGNQLFQLANALSLDHNREIYLEWTLGKPRCNTQGLPDIMSFQVPSRVHMRPATRYSRFVSKTIGYILRTGIAPKNWEKLTLIRSLKILLGNLVLSAYFKEITQIKCGVGIGYSPIEIKNRNSFIVGYFQTYRFKENYDTYRDLRLLSLALPSNKLTIFEEIAEIEKPIVVHFRFGDYKLESTFGIPSANYYRKALQVMLKENPGGRIWVFTDEEEEARKVFPSEYNEEARWFTDTNLSSAETLELMRLGTCYVIANSTFSWWGAILSKAENPSVICPDVWFRFEDEPLDLIPPSWKRVAAWE